MIAGAARAPCAPTPAGVHVLARPTACASASTDVKLVVRTADATSEMAGERSRYGLSVSALGAGVLAAAVFMPWYRVLASPASASASSALRHRVATLNGIHALPALSAVLLVLAVLATLDALTPLASARAAVPSGAGGAVLLLGAVAAGAVVFRMLDPAIPAGTALFGTLREGAWLALMGSLTMMLGAMWPRYVAPGELGRATPGTLSLN